MLIVPPTMRNDASIEPGWASSSSAASDDTRTSDGSEVSVPACVVPEGVAVAEPDALADDDDDPGAAVGSETSVGCGIGAGVGGRGGGAVGAAVGAGVGVGGGPVTVTTGPTSGSGCGSAEVVAW